MSHEVSQQEALPRHIPSLDGIRGTAALMVIIFHLWQHGLLRWIPVSDNLLKLCILGQTGVDLFFVLSGFLITRILLREKGEQYYFRNFYIRRTLRIFPLYYLYLCFHYFVLPILLNQPMSEFRTQWWFWCYIQNVPMTFNAGEYQGPNHYWSLAVEEHFYILWPFLVYMLTRKTLAVVSILMICLSIITRVVMESRGLSVFYFTPCRLDAITAGTLLAIYEPVIRNSNFIKRNYLAIVLTGIVCSVMMGVIFNRLSINPQIWKFSLYALVYSLVIAMAGLMPENFLTRIFKARILIFLGSISYGLYVYHPAIISLTDSYLPEFKKTLWPALIIVISTLAVAVISFNGFEKRIQKLKNKFHEAKTGRNAANLQENE